MSEIFCIRHFQRIVAFILLMVIATCVFAAQARKHSKLNVPGSADTEVLPELVNVDTNPTLRFPIARTGATIGSTSYGWLDISHSGVQYKVEQPSQKVTDGFSASMAEVRDPKINSHIQTLSFRAGEKKEEIFYVRQEAWGSIRHGRDLFVVMADGFPGTESILNALLNFDSELALVKSAAAPPAPAVAPPVVTPPSVPKPAAPPPAPAIVVTSPSGAGANQTVDVSECPLVIRGVVMDTTGMPVVSVNGQPASMRPQSPQAAEFWSDPMPLQPGANPVQVVASNSAHVQATMAFTVHYTPKIAPVNPQALDKAEIISLLEGSVPAARVAEIIKQRGVKFTPTADDLNEIRAAGGSDEVIRAIQQEAISQ